MICRLSLVLAVMSLPSLPAAAQTVDARAAAQAAYAAGDWQAARSHGRAAGSADGLALASEASLVEAGYLMEGPARDRALARAQADAAAALALDPGHVKAHLQMAGVVGVKARDANSIGLAKEARAHIDAALAQDPDNALALAALGSWHAEIIVSAGGFGARLAFGATKAKAMEAVEAAVHLAPNDPWVRFNHAQVLVRLGKRADRAEGMAELRALLDMAPQSGLDRVVQQRVAQVFARSAHWQDEDRVEQCLPFAALPQPAGDRVALLAD